MAENLEQIIRERAYQIWEAEGRPGGRDHEHWLRAEAEVKRGAAAPARAAKAPAAGKRAAKAAPKKAAEKKAAPRKAAAKSAGAAKPARSRGRQAASTS